MREKIFADLLFFFVIVFNERFCFMSRESVEILIKLCQSDIV